MWETFRGFLLVLFGEFVVKVLGARNPLFPEQHSPSWNYTTIGLAILIDEIPVILFPTCWVTSKMATVSVIFLINGSLTKVEYEINFRVVHFMFEFKASWKKYKTEIFY